MDSPVFKIYHSHWFVVLYLISSHKEIDNFKKSKKGRLLELLQLISTYQPSTSRFRKSFKDNPLTTKPRLTSSGSPTKQYFTSMSSWRAIQASCWRGFIFTLASIMLGLVQDSLHKPLPRSPLQGLQLDIDLGYLFTYIVTLVVSFCLKSGSKVLLANCMSYHTSFYTFHHSSIYFSRIGTALRAFLILLSFIS